jgi:uncharacterized protein (TIGR03067 family)
MRRCLLVLFLLLGVGAVCSPVGADPTQDDKDKIQGTWSLVSLATQQKILKKIASKDPEHFYLIFAGDKVTRRSGDQVVEGTYILDATKMPKTIDITWEGRTDPGIYELNGDQLRINLSEGAQDKARRPSKFDEKDLGAHTRLMEFRREKP